MFETSGASPRAGGGVAGGAYAAVDSPALIDPLSPAEVDAQFEALVRDAEIRAWTLEDLDPSRVDHTAALLRQPPGAVTAAAIDECTRTVADLPDADVVELTAAAHRLASWALSTQLMAMAELHRRWSTPPPGWGGASARQVAEDLARRAAVAEVALACGISEYAAGQRMSAAVQLSRRLPATFDALTSGRLDWPKVQAITETTVSLPEPVAILVERAVLPGAAGQNVPALRRALARAVIDADPAAAGECADHANSERRVVFTPAPDGMSELWALLPAEGAIRAKAGLDALATAARSPGDDRSADQRRADALIDLLSAGVSEPVGAVGPAAPPGARAGLAPEVVVTVSLETLLGLADDPAHLAGYGPVLADIARDVAARGTWRCAVVDGTHGTLLGLGRATFTPEYRPGAPLADHITVRDRTCTFPGCHQPARRCDNDHRTPHPKGPTCECNVAALCRHHHRLKHRAGFGAGLSDDPSHPPGSVIWTTPTGRTYDRPATRIATAPREHAPPSDA